MVYQPDGGIPPSADCSTISPPAGPALVEIMRGGSEVFASLNTIAARGQLTESADFSLSGTLDLGGDAGNVQTVKLRGYFIAGSSKDGGTGGTPAQIKGSWITRTEKGSKACDAEVPFVGTKR